MASAEKTGAAAAPEVVSRRSLHAPEVRHDLDDPIVDHDATAPEPFQQRQDEYAAHYSAEEPVQKKRRICGLRPVTFWLALALAVVVIGGAVGGGVGGSLANSGGDKSAVAAASLSASSQSTTPGTALDNATVGISTSSTTPTTASASFSSSATTYATTGYTGIAALSCTPNKIYTTPNSSARFEEHCFVNWPAGMAGVEGKVQDLDNLVRYSFQSCMDACDAYNGRSSGGGLCQAVTYDQNLTSSVSHNGGNCVLKSTNGATDPAYDYIASAVRLQ